MRSVSCIFYIMKYPLLLTKRASEKLKRTGSVTIWPLIWQKQVWLKLKYIYISGCFYISLYKKKILGGENLARADIWLNWPLGKVDATCNLILALF